MLDQASLTVDVVALEIARGSDGLLRGNPEPVLILGVFADGPLGLALIARHVARFPTPAAIPSTLVAPHLVRMVARVGPVETAFYLVALAVEEDSGDDLARLYGALERPDRLMVWAEGDALPNPTPMKEVSSGRFTSATPVHLLVDGVRADEMRGDDWVGASLLRVSATERHVADVRLSFLAPDRRNDWTARLKVRMRRLSTEAS